MVSFWITLQRRKHTFLLIICDMHSSHNIQVKMSRDHVSVVHLVMHAPQGCDSVMHASVVLTCVTDGARSTMGNMLRQVIAPLHQKQRHQDPLLIVRFCLCRIACALTRIPVGTTHALSSMHIISLFTRRQSQNVISVITTQWSTTAAFAMHLLCDQSPCMRAC